MSHPHDCKHDRVEYCKTCSLVYCKDCKYEWVQRTTWTYTYTPGYQPYPITWYSGNTGGGSLNYQSGSITGTIPTIGIETAGHHDH